MHVYLRTYIVYSKILRKFQRFDCAMNIDIRLVEFFEKIKKIIVQLSVEKLDLMKFFVEKLRTYIA